jgi:HD-GYP domain-containing protein (c-di-GMP phosphodiesterase class II)
MAMALSKAVDLLEGRPLRHGIRVAWLTTVLADLMALPDTLQRQGLMEASLLHDVGLLLVNRHLLANLPTGISEMLWLGLHPLAPVPALLLGDAAMLTRYLPQDRLSPHPLLAADLLDRLPLPKTRTKQSKVWIATHHERRDGSGYPLGLSGEAVPLEGQLIGLADMVETLLGQANGLAARQHLLERFLELPELRAWFLPELIDALVMLTRDDRFLRRLASAEIETWLMQRMQAWEEPLGGNDLLAFGLAISHFCDERLPGHKHAHGEAVATLAARMAQMLEIDTHQTGELILAALLHDLGEWAVPLSVLTRGSQQTLNPLEWRRIQDHPQLTEDILKGVPGLARVARWASEHHERMNGTGYPAHRKGSDFSTAGRILGMCDVYDALTSPRPYRSLVLTPPDALAMMRQGRFRLYDTKLLDVFQLLIHAELSLEKPAIDLLPARAAASKETTSCDSLSLPMDAFA